MRNRNSGLTSRRRSAASMPASKPPWRGPRCRTSAAPGCRRRSPAGDRRGARASPGSCLAHAGLLGRALRLAHEDRPPARRVCRGVAAGVVRIGPLMVTLLTTGCVSWLLYGRRNGWRTPSASIALRLDERDAEIARAAVDGQLRPSAPGSSARRRRWGRPAPARGAAARSARRRG